MNKHTNIVLMNLLSDSSLSEVLSLLSLLGLLAVGELLPWREEFLLGLLNIDGVVDIDSRVWKLMMFV